MTKIKRLKKQGTNKVASGKPTKMVPEGVESREESGSSQKHSTTQSKQGKN